MAATENMMRRRKRGVPISVTLAMSIGGLTVIAVGAVLLISWQAGRQNTLDLLNEKSISIVETIETGIQNHLDPAVAQLAFLGRRIASGPSTRPAAIRITTLFYVAARSPTLTQPASSWPAIS